MKLATVVSAVVFAMLSLPAVAQAQSGRDSQAIATVQKFEHARHDFDLPAITKLVADDYVEVSPLGEVDPHDEMLSYYAPDKKSEAPPMQLTELSTRPLGDSAVVLGTLTYTMQSKPMSIRVIWTVRNTAGTWKLVSAAIHRHSPGPLSRDARCP